MEHIGAGLAAMGVIGPGIGIGILAGMAAGAIGRAARRRPQEPSVIDLEPHVQEASAAALRFSHARHSG